MNAWETETGFKLIEFDLSWKLWMNFSVKNLLIKLIWTEANRISSSKFCSKIIESNQCKQDHEEKPT